MLMGAFKIMFGSTKGGNLGNFVMKNDLPKKNIV